MIESIYDYYFIKDWKRIPKYLDQTTNTIDFRHVITGISSFKVNKLDIMYKKRQTRETNVNQIIIEGDREDIIKNLDISKNIGFHVFL